MYKYLPYNLMSLYSKINKKFLPSVAYLSFSINLINRHV